MALETTSWVLAVMTAVTAPAPHDTEPAFGSFLTSGSARIQAAQPSTPSPGRHSPSGSLSDSGSDTGPAGPQGVSADATADIPPGDRLVLPPDIKALAGTALEDAVQCLALNIYHEARSESEQGQRAVAAVTINRVASPAFPDSVCKVVRQGAQGGQRRRGCQFSWACDGYSDKPREQGAWERALELSRKALKGRIGDPTHGALYYHASYAKPRWSRTFERTNRIGRHLFYKPRGA